MNIINKNTLIILLLLSIIILSFYYYKLYSLHNKCVKNIVHNLDDQKNEIISPKKNI